MLAPDPKYGSLLASKFINCMMWSGKKSIVQTVFYDALDIIGEKITDVEPIEVFTQAVENVKPNIEVRSKRVGGASYQVPDAGQPQPSAIAGHSLDPRPAARRRASRCPRSWPTN